MKHSKLFLLLLLSLGSIDAMESQQKYLDVQLCFAVSWQDSNMVKSLLEKKANPNFIGKNETSTLLYCNKLECALLHESAIKSNRQIAQLLLHHKADINIKDNISWTPLHTSAANGLSDMVTFFIENKADLKICNSNGHSPLILAIYHNKPECVKIILENTKKLKLRPYEYISLLKKHFPLTEKLILTILCSLKMSLTKI